MSFAEEVTRWGEQAMVKQRRVLERTADLAKDSIVNGSSLTGSPGQPEVSGRLKRSWRITLDPQGAVVSTDVPYAPQIEDGVRPEGRPLQVGRAHGGGPHSLKITVAGLPRLVEQAVAEVTAA